LGASQRLRGGPGKVLPAVPGGAAAQD